MQKAYGSVVTILLFPRLEGRKLKIKVVQTIEVEKKNFLII